MYGTTSDLLIAWAAPYLAASYRAADLHARDLARATAPRSPRAQRDWQVSRALLHSVRAATATPVHSLSHKHGHAVCAAAPAGWRVGVDLEKVVPRDVMRLADWVCSAPERRTLAKLSGQRQLAYFYTVWTLKEAFIKAADLVFPADMASVGLMEDENLHTPPGKWQACTWRLEPDWMVSLVWQAPNVTRSSPHWFAPTGDMLPQRVLSGYWQSRLG